MSRLVGAVVGLFVAGVLAGCGHGRALETSSEDFEFEAGASPRVEVRLERGRIETSVSTSGRIELEVRKRARGRDHESSRNSLEGIDVEVQEIEGGIRVESRWEPSRSSLLGGDFGVELLLRVPERTDLDLRTVDGSIEVRDVFGTISAESGDGRIELVGVSGSIRARSADGGIRGRDLKGSVDARTDDGRIELEGRFDALEATTVDGGIRVTARESTPRALNEEWTLRTSDGSIRLDLPSILSANIEAAALDGDIELSFPGFRGERKERRIRGTLGGGGALILLSAIDGAIRIEEN